MGSGARHFEKNETAASAVLRSLLDTSTDGLLVVDHGGLIAAWNARLVDLFGIPDGVLSSRRFEALMSFALDRLENREVFAASLRRLRDSPTATTVDRLRLLDGKTLECSSRAYDASLRVWTFRDVTASLKAEVALRASEERYRGMYESTPVMMHSIDPEGRLLSVSNAWLRILGYTREEVLGRKSVEFLTAESQQYARDVVLPEYFANGWCNDVHYQITKKNGEVIDVLLSAICERDDRGEVVRSLAVLIDVTEKLRVEAERDRLLVEAESAAALLDTLFRTAPIGLGFVSADLRYLRSNEALAAAHGVKPGGDLGRNVWEAIPDLAPTVVPAMQQVLATREPITNVEVTGRVGETGEVRSWLASYYPVCAGVPTCGDEPIGVGIVTIDVTEQRRLYREAQEAIRVRDDFLAIASHEIRTPLTRLALRLQVLARAMQQHSSADTPLLEKALVHVGQLTSLVNDLLDVSRIESGGLGLRFAPMSLGAMVRDLVSIVRETCPKERLIELETCSDDEVIVDGDRARLEQVVSNLIDNALKFSASATPVRVRVGVENGEAVVSVADHGIGIPKEQQAMLFERFFRAKNAPISGYGGLGLGLYVSRDIVEKHGGRIRVESEPGNGARFIVTLPRRERGR